MKKFNLLSKLSAFAMIALLASCSMNKQGKITEIPITTKSDEAKATIQQGLASLDQNDFQKARASFAKATEQDPKCAIAYVLRASTANSPKDFSDNLAKAKENLEGASDYEKWYVEYTNTFATNDWNQRLEITKKIASTYPDCARAQVDLGLTYSAGNDEGNARACFQKAIELNPKWVGGYTASVNSYVFVAPKDFKKAEECALKAVEVAPSSAGVEVALGDCYRAQNNLEKARDAYGKAISVDPSSSEAYYKKGNANSFLGNLDEARKNFMEGASHDDNKIGPVMAMGNTYIYGGDCKTALNYFNEQAAKADASGESQGVVTQAKYGCITNAATIAMHTGDAATLKDLIAKLEPIAMQMGADAGATEAQTQQKATIQYWQSIEASLEGNFDGAKAKAEEMKTTLDPIKDPNKLDGYEFALGFASMKQKNYTDAVAHFGKTQQNSVYNKYWLATAELAAGDKDKGASILKDIADYNFNEVGYALIRNDVKKTLASL